MNEQKIRDIIDSHLEKWIDIELNKRPGKIEEEMADPNQDKDEEWKTWIPIDSKVTNSEIDNLEEQIGHKLPLSYKIFLKHKHFYELHISEASFCGHPVNSWMAKQEEMIYDGNPVEYLIEKGFVPFADWSDWGLLCFNTNKNKDNHNYPIVLWDHEIADKVENKFNDFYDLLIKLDAEENKNIG